MAHIAFSTTPFFPVTIKNSPGDNEKRFNFNISTSFPELQFMIYNLNSCTFDFANRLKEAKQNLCKDDETIKEEMY